MVTFDILNFSDKSYDKTVFIKNTVKGCNNRRN